MVQAPARGIATMGNHIHAFSHPSSLYSVESHPTSPRAIAKTTPMRMSQRCPRGSNADATTAASSVSPTTVSNARLSP
jgi:hypothetical protein